MFKVDEMMVVDGGIDESLTEGGELMKVGEWCSALALCLALSSDNHRSRVPKMVHVQKSSQGSNEAQTSWIGLKGHRYDD